MYGSSYGLNVGQLFPPLLLRFLVFIYVTESLLSNMNMMEMSFRSRRDSEHT